MKTLLNFKISKVFFNKFDINKFNPNYKKKKKEYSDSVPLKVYQYLKTKDQLLKEDLIKNHANHWMVLQYKL